MYISPTMVYQRVTKFCLHYLSCHLTSIVFYDLWHMPFHSRHFELAFSIMCPSKSCQWASTNNRPFHTFGLIRAGKTKTELITILMAQIHMDAPVSHARVNMHNTSTLKLAHLNGMQPSVILVITYTCALSANTSKIPTVKKVYIHFNNS